MTNDQVSNLIKLRILFAIFFATRNFNTYSLSLKLSLYLASMIIVATELHVKKFSKFFRFTWLALRSMSQAKKSPGCLFANPRSKGWRIGFTLTAWDNRESMLHFRNTGPHKVAMQEIRNVSSRYKTIVWESDILPNWDEALLKLREVSYKELS